MQQNNERQEKAASSQEEEIVVPCCSEIVHIAYRGKADDRLYMAYGRRWQELRYYQDNGLKVFCSVCRSRVY